MIDKESTYRVSEKFDDETVRRSEEFMRLSYKYDFDEYCRAMGITGEMINRIRIYIDYKLNGFGKITPILDDYRIEDITVISDSYVYVYNREYGYMKTDLYLSGNEVRELVKYAVQRAGKTISEFNPVVDFTFRNFRVQAIYENVGKPSLSIRRLNPVPLSPVDLIRNGTVDSEIMAYIWEIIEYGSNIIVTGTTAAGKTTFLNAIMSFIPESFRIVTVEDTEELSIFNSNALTLKTRSSAFAGGRKITFGYLSGYAIRMNPGYIIYGELRGTEIRNYLDAVTGGIPSMSTVHSSGAADLIKRMQSPPVQASPADILSMDAIIEMKFDEKRYVKRVSEVFNEDGISVNNIYDMGKYGYENSGYSYLIKRLARKAGKSENAMMDEIAGKKRFLDGIDENIDYAGFYNSVCEFRKSLGF